MKQLDVDDGDDEGNDDDNEVDDDDDDEEEQTKACAGYLAELNQLGETLQTLGKNALLHKFN